MATAFGEPANFRVGGCRSGTDVDNSRKKRGVTKKRSIHFFDESDSACRPLLVDHDLQRDRRCRDLCGRDRALIAQARFVRITEY